MTDVVKQQQETAKAEGDSAAAHSGVPVPAATVQKGEMPPVNGVAAKDSSVAASSTSGDKRTVPAGPAAAKPSASAKSRPAAKTSATIKASRQPAAVKTGEKAPSLGQASAQACSGEVASCEDEQNVRKPVAKARAAGKCTAERAVSGDTTKAKTARKEPSQAKIPAVVRQQKSSDSGNEPAAADVLAEALRHGEHVARLAGALFDQLQDLHGLDPDWRRRLLEAARLHDIGFVTGKKGHHKASMRRILDDEEIKLPSEDRPLVALLARYHRKAWPSCKHGQFAALPRATRKALRRAAALLRVADGLDYTHQSLVKGLAVTMKPRSVVLVLHGKAECPQEMERAVRKGDLFAHVFGLQVECACQPD